MNFHRTPSFGAQRVQWIEAISKHQEFDFHNTNFKVCGRHFSQNDFENQNILKVDSVPSIFDIVETNILNESDMPRNSIETCDALQDMSSK